MTDHAYGTAFMSVTSLSRLSAERIVPLVKGFLAINSVADFGCALGTWLSVWQEHGVREIQGLDGYYVKGQTLEVPECFIHFRDLTEPIDLGRRFDLVQSLEVAEHLPYDAAETFIDTLTKHSDAVLFSAAPPGQGGEHHINEQPYGFWRDLFAHRNYAMLDCVRPEISDQRKVRYWYRYNTFLYVHESAMDRLAQDLAATRIPDCVTPPDISPAMFKLRKAVVGVMPRALNTFIAQLLSTTRTAR